MKLKALVPLAYEGKHVEANKAFDVKSEADANYLVRTKRAVAVEVESEAETLEDDSKKTGKKDK